MAKQGEIDYLKNIGEEGQRHAAAKPWSDRYCARYLMQLGAVMSLFPPKPAKVLDIGCGTGWTSVFFAKAGYETTGLDIAPDMIALADQNKAIEELINLSFVCADYESADFDGQFDVAVFYDALHHAIDEDQALRMAYRSLRPGGICIASEPGRGHHDSQDAIDHVKRFNVTEKDMPPDKICAIGKRAGFRAARVFPHAFEISHAVYESYDRSATVPLKRAGVLRMFNLYRRMRAGGLVLLMK